MDEIGDLKKFKALVATLSGAQVQRFQYRSIEIEFQDQAKKAEVELKVKEAEKETEQEEAQDERTYDPFSDTSAASHAETLEDEIRGVLD